MSAKLWEASTRNAFATTLNGSITAGDASITLTSVTGLVAPGILVIDRIDSNNVATPLVREYISYTGISTNTLTGCSRGLGGSTAGAHASGAVVEETLSVTHWGDLIDFLQVSHDASGNILSSTATITSGTFDTLRVVTHLNASGASLTGNFPINPVWQFTATGSTVTGGIGKALYAPNSGSWKWFSVTLTQPASGSTMVLDVNKNGSSIFDAGTRLMIAGGGTYASTASISTKIFTVGDKITVDVDQIGINDTDPIVQGRS